MNIRGKENVNYISKRDYAIDFVKFLATFFVMNSHMEICYPKYSFLATGGAIGNSLFFFSSGFTLFISKDLSFPNYIKRRITRIYPAVIAIAFVACMVWRVQESFIEAFIHYWFVNCIMVYYVLLWICRRYKVRMKYVMLISIIIISIIFLTFYDFTNKGVVYGDESFRYFLYFPIMALGAYMATNRNKYKFKFGHAIILFMSVLCWYVSCFLFSHKPYQLISLIFLMLICYSLYICSNPIITKLNKQTVFKKSIPFIGGLCLEVYLIQFYLITNQYNNLFPLNILLIWVIILLSGLLLHIFSELISQTFSNLPYDTKRLLKI